MNSREIKEKIVKIAEETIGAFLEEDVSLKECGVDSLALVTLVVSIEEAFGVSFSDDDLQPENLHALSDLVALTERYL